jgi:hypothetical protein
MDNQLRNEELASLNPEDAEHRASLNPDDAWVVKVGDDELTIADLEEMHPYLALEPLGGWEEGF